MYFLLRPIFGIFLLLQEFVRKTKVRFFSKYTRPISGQT